MLEGFLVQRADKDALIDVIRRVSALVEGFPELTELELNPVVVMPRGEGAVALDARIRMAPLRPAVP